MKSTSRKKLLAALFLSLCVTSSSLGTLSSVHAEETAKTTKTTRAKATRAKALMGIGAIEEVSATSLKFTDKTGTHDIVLNDATEISRVETGVAAADLKVGDTLQLVVPGTNGQPTVQSLAPLTLQFDNATITFNDTAKGKFARLVKITAAELATGQTVKVTYTPQADGTSVAAAVLVTATKPK